MELPTALSSRAVASLPSLTRLSTRPVAARALFAAKSRASQRLLSTSSYNLAPTSSPLTSAAGSSAAPSSYFQRPSLPANTIIRFVPQQTAWLVERMGKYHRILNPGLAVLIPFIDRIAYVKSLKESAIEIPSQSAITADNVTLELDGVLYTRVDDAYKACYGVEDAEYAISQLAQTTMRSEIGQLALDAVLKERTTLNSKITVAINEASQAWGVVCLRYEIRDIHAPKDVVAAMHRQVTAERTKRAEILDSEGQRQSAINIAEGRKQSVILASEAMQAQEVNIASGEAQAILVKAKATAQGIDNVARAIGQGKDAAKGAVSLSVAEKYVDAFGKLAKEGTAVVVPGNVGDMGGMIASALAVYGKIGEGMKKGEQQKLLEAASGEGEGAEQTQEQQQGYGTTAPKSDQVAQSVLQGFEEAAGKK